MIVDSWRKRSRFRRTGTHAMSDGEYCQVRQNVQLLSSYPPHPRPKTSFAEFLARVCRPKNLNLRISVEVNCRCTYVLQNVPQSSRCSHKNVEASVEKSPLFLEGHSTDDSRNADMRRWLIFISSVAGLCTFCRVRNFVFKRSDDRIKVRRNL